MGRSETTDSDADSHSYPSEKDTRRVIKPDVGIFPDMLGGGGKPRRHGKQPGHPKGSDGIRAFNPVADPVRDFGREQFTYCVNRL